MKVACFDLETTGLDANFGVVLCGVIKAFPPENSVKTTPYVFRRDKYANWDKRSYDKDICLDIYKKLSEFDIWIAHNGLNFDEKFLRTRLGKYGIRVPKNKMVDPVMIARRYLRLGSYSLKSVATHFGIFGKTEVLPCHWQQAALDGDKKSMGYIVEHCVADVDVLERVAKEISYLVPKVSQWGSDL